VVLRENLWHYGLELNEAKAKLHPFGRNCPPRGPGKSVGFDFLGLTHFVSRDRQGRYLVKRKTARKRLHRRSQTSRKERITRLLNESFALPMPKIMQPDNWLSVDPGYLLGRAGCGNAARPVL
jgi:hypothetical protein